MPTKAPGTAHRAKAKAPARSRARVRTPAPTRLARPEVRGKFLYVGGDKLLVKGVTYGPFRPDETGCEYHDESAVERDFSAMAAAGFNVVRTYTVPPEWMLDCAMRHGLWIMVGIAWADHVTFLDRRRMRNEIEQAVRVAVRRCNWHGAVLCYVIGNEIPSSIVRWYGPRRIERFLRRLYQAVKEEDPHALVTYVNYPTTEYLQLGFTDLCCFNVYVEDREALGAYVARLQHLAGNRPLVLAEVGLDSGRHGEEAQAESTAWQVRTAFEGGCAGVCVFSWTDEWFRGGHDIDSWCFGLTDRTRQAKPALGRLREVFADVPFASATLWPRVSIVVCTYNGAKTIEETCAALNQIDYPDYEVVVVCDGSTDHTLSILDEYDFNVIRVGNGGLSRARNIGMMAATGEIVAYLDDDAYPDPDWLKHLAWAFMHTRHAGIGGPNIPPPNDGLEAEAVAHSPGGPNHVMVDDRIAEHIPGCNMAFRKTWLERINGFDPQFRIAGDDVDLCWRIQDDGGTLGFSAGAMVWHHRRGNVNAYLRQQWNYGRAEAMLATKWPLKFNTAGHVRWGGRIYGPGVPASPFSTPRIYHGTWGTAPFQSRLEGATSVLAALPLMPEWYLLVALAVIASLVAPFVPVFRPAILVLIGVIGVPACQALQSAMRARLSNEHADTSERFKTRALITLLQLLQPGWRLHGRLREPTKQPRLRTGRNTLRPFRNLVRWHEMGASVGSRLERIEQALATSRTRSRRGSAFDRWDLEVVGGALGAVRLSMAIEEHGEGKQLVRVRRSPHPRPTGLWMLTLAASVPVASLFLGGWRAAIPLSIPLALVAGRLLTECLAASHDARSAVESEEASIDAATSKAAKPKRFPIFRALRSARVQGGSDTGEKTAT